jgi:hypothetical protein
MFTQPYLPSPFARVISKLRGAARRAAVLCGCGLVLALLQPSPALGQRFGHRGGGMPFRAPFSMRSPALNHPLRTHPFALHHLSAQNRALTNRQLFLQNQARMQSMARMANTSQLNSANRTVNVNTPQVNVATRTVNTASTSRVNAGNQAAVNAALQFARFPGSLNRRLLALHTFARREAALFTWNARLGAQGLLNPYAISPFGFGYGFGGTTAGGYSGGGYGGGGYGGGGYGGGGYPGGGYGMNSPGLSPYGSNPYDFTPSDYEAYLRLLARSLSTPPASSSGQSNPDQQRDPAQDSKSKDSK